MTASIDRGYRGHRGREYLLVPEVDILGYGYPGRIDALLVANRITGFEIKSDVDSLHRLPRQLSVYGPAIERGTLIVGTRHVKAAEGLLPPWWAMWTAVRRKNGAVAFETYRPGRLNPDLCLHTVATFIPREELVRHVRTQGNRGYSRLTAYELRDSAVNMHSRADFLALARWVMRSRSDWRYRAAQLRGSEHQFLGPASSQCLCPLCESRGSKARPPGNAGEEQPMLQLVSQNRVTNLLELDT